MNTTMTALNRIGAQRAAAKELDRQVRKFNKLAESEPFHNGTWDITLAGINALEKQLREVAQAKTRMEMANAKFNAALASVPGARVAK